MSTKTTQQKDLIIRLIQQDLKHNQLVLGLRKLGLDPDIHALEISDIVAQLMGLNREEVSDQWAETYLSFFEQVDKYEITILAEELRPLAEECYNLLVACMGIEERIKPED